MAATATTRIHVGGLGQSVSSDDLRKLFSAVGMVEALDIIRTKGRSFAYVDILPSSSNSVSKLFSTYNGCVWKGGKLKLEKAKEHYLTRLRREWAEAKEAEAEAEAEEDHEALPSFSDNFSKNNKFQLSQNSYIRIFFPRLRKVKSLPLSGTGKHKYSFQRVEAPALPTHFCDCEEHSGRFNTVKQKQVQQHQEVNGAMNEEEISMMNSVMNRFFKRGNISNTSEALLAKERDDSIKAIEDSLSHEEEEEDDDLIINVVSYTNKGAAVSGSTEQQAISKKRRLGETQISNDGAIQSVHKVQKKNVLHPNKKRKPLSNKEEDIDEGVYVSDGKERNSEFDKRGADFEENEADDDNLIINAVSTANKRMVLPGCTKTAKASPKQKFKSCEIQICEGESTQNEHHVQEKDLLLPNNSMKSCCAEERNENEVAPTVNAEKGNSQTQPNGSVVVTLTTRTESALKQSSSSCSWSQKSSWRALVGDSSNNAFSLSNILQNVDATMEKQQISDGPKTDNTLDSRSEKLATPDNFEGMLGKMEIVDVVAKSQPNQPNMTSNNSGRGSSWLHKSSWVQLVSDKSGSFSISEILPISTSTNQEHANTSHEDVTYDADGNESTITNLHNSEPRVDGSTAVDDRNGDILQSIPETGQQNLGGNKDGSAPIVQEICNSQPNKAFGGDTCIGETCSFVRSSASLKEWFKIKAALKGSRMKKGN